MLLFNTVNPLFQIIGILTFGLVFTLSIPAARVNLIRSTTLSISTFALIAGILSCLSFDKSNLGFQFISRFSFIPQYNIAFTVGADGLSMLFLLLTLFIFPILFLAAWSVTQQPKRFLNYLLAMELLLVLTFASTDLFYFFVFFESLLIPMFILIGIWGARERKIKAAYYFFLFTLAGSLFMLFGVFYLYSLTGSTSYSILFTSKLDAEQQKIIWICFFLAFAVKMPLFPFHIWLPEAHVEAPTVGSMLLASLLLKLGGYGFIRFSLSLLSEGSTYYAPVVSTCALLGVIYGSLSTLRQIDLKRIIAYSSVAHMNLVMLGLFSNNQQGLEGAIYLMLGHGVVSTALFFAVGVLYDRHHTRLLRYYGGAVTVMPLFAVFFFMFTLANMSFPATSNFLGEVLIFLGIFANNSTVLLFSTAGIVLSAVYSVWLYNRVVFGTLKTQYINEFSDLNAREVTVFIILLLSMGVLGLSGTWVVEYTHALVKSLVLLTTNEELVASMAFFTMLFRPFLPQNNSVLPVTEIRKNGSSGLGLLLPVVPFIPEPTTVLIAALIVGAVYGAVTGYQWLTAPVVPPAGPVVPEPVGPYLEDAAGHIILPLGPDIVFLPGLPQDVAPTTLFLKSLSGGDPKAAAAAKAQAAATAAAKAKALAETIKKRRPPFSSCVRPPPPIVVGDGNKNKIEFNSKDSIEAGSLYDPSPAVPVSPPPSPAPLNPPTAGPSYLDSLLSGDPTTVGLTGLVIIAGCAVGYFLWHKFSPKVTAQPTPKSEVTLEPVQPVQDAVVDAAVAQAKETADVLAGKTQKAAELLHQQFLLDCAFYGFVALLTGYFLVELIKAERLGDGLNKTNPFIPAAVGFILGFTLVITYYT